MDDVMKHLQKRYRNGQTYFQVIGLITSPAVIMKDPITGERKTVVIGCMNHREMEEIDEREALEIAESHLHFRPQEVTTGE